ncbi:MAG: DNA repair protein RadC [Firmicutes bacterium]|nr:DNA repair protein RadC [Bacillota bacterium]
MKENIHENHRSRIRKRFTENGLKGFADHEVLELLLYYCYPRKDTNAIAHAMLREYGSLYNLFEADIQDIVNRCNTTQNVAVLLTMIPKLANLYFSSKWTTEKPILDNLDTAIKYATSLFIGRTKETFYIFCLDSAYKLNQTALIAEGTLSETPIYPREIVSEALKHQAVNLILAHNHPSGNATPSHQDIETTKKIAEIMQFLGITLIDHLIIAGINHYSFAANKSIVFGY